MPMTPVIRKPEFVKWIIRKPEFVKWILVFFLIIEFSGGDPKPRLQLLAYALTQVFAGLQNRVSSCARCGLLRRISIQGLQAYPVGGVGRLMLLVPPLRRFSAHPVTRRKTPGALGSMNIPQK